MGTQNPDIVTSIAFNNKGVYIRMDEDLKGWSTGWKWKENNETSEDTLIDQIERDFGVSPKRKYKFITHILKDEIGIDFYLIRISKPEIHQDFDFEIVTFDKFESLLKGRTHGGITMSDGYIGAKKEIINALTRELIRKQQSINVIGLT
jgi:hypothetical protein